MLFRIGCSVGVSTRHRNRPCLHYAVLSNRRFRTEGRFFPGCRFLKLVQTTSERTPPKRKSLTWPLAENESDPRDGTRTSVDAKHTTHTRARPPFSRVQGVHCRRSDDDCCHRRAVTPPRLCHPVGGAPTRLRPKNATTTTLNGSGRRLSAPSTMRRRVQFAGRFFFLVPLTPSRRGGGTPSETGYRGQCSRLLRTESGFRSFGRTEAITTRRATTNERFEMYSVVLLYILYYRIICILHTVITFSGKN